MAYISYITIILELTIRPSLHTTEYWRHLLKWSSYMQYCPSQLHPSFGQATWSAFSSLVVALSGKNYASGRVHTHWNSCYVWEQKPQRQYCRAPMYAHNYIAGYAMTCKILIDLILVDLYKFRQAKVTNYGYFYNIHLCYFKTVASKNTHRNSYYITVICNSLPVYLIWYNLLSTSRTLDYFVPTTHLKKRQGAK